MDRDQFIWEHFKFNAEQRLRVFNFYILLSMFVVGGILTSIEKSLAPIIIGGMGFFTCLLAGLFHILDSRSKELIDLAVPALKEMEKQYPKNSRLFSIDAEKRHEKKRYTFAFQTLIFLQFSFGLGVMVYAFVK